MERIGGLLLAAEAERRPECRNSTPPFETRGLLEPDGGHRYALGTAAALHKPDLV